MKKCFSRLIALVLIAVIGTGCAQKEPPSGVYYDVTGIDPKSIACTAGETQFPAEMYLYWIAYTCSSMEYNLNMYYAYYGAYSEMFDENGALLWDAEFMDGLTLSEYVKQQAEDSARFYAAIENKAKEVGITLNEEDQSALDASFNAMVEQMGGEEAFQENLEMMGISRESFDRIAGDARLFERLRDEVTEEGGALYLEPEEYERYASYTDHILLMTKDQETNEDLSEEEIAQKYETAQDLLSQLQNAGDSEVEALFDQLAEEYSEDPGRATSKGYVVTEDTSFVQEFLDAALSLEPGQVSDLVESTYGYHILYRRNLSDMLEQNPDQLAALAEEYLYDLLDADIEAMELTVSEEIAAIDAGEFYTGYNAKIEELTAAKEAENSTADGTDDDGGSTDGSAGTDGDAAADGDGADGTDE